MRQARLALGILVAAMLAMASAAAGGGDPQIGYGPPLPGLQDAQSEPAIAVDAGAVARGTPPAQQPLVVGANDYYDEPVCGAGVACSFKSGVGISGVYFSFDSVTNLWTGGTRWTGQGKLPYLGTTTRTEPMRRGRIVTVPLFEKRLASHGDPALAFGPRSVPGDGFAWNSGSRLYYATLAQPYKLPQPQATARQLIVVSRTDKVTAAAQTNPLASSTATKAWMPPVIVSGRPGDYFADKPAIWADNAASSQHFGSVYVCWASYRSESEAVKYEGSPRPILFSRSTNGGANWSPPIGLAPGQASGVTRQGCAIRTDSKGTVYVVWEGSTGHRASSIFMTKSFDGGATFGPARTVTAVYDVGEADKTQHNRKTFDGITGARTNSWPSIDIANGAPCATPPSANPVCPPAPDTIVVAWSDAGSTNGIDTEKALVRYSKDKGTSWSDPIDVTARPPSGYTLERPDFPAVAISPNGTILYVVYTAFHDRWQLDPLNASRRMGGVFRAVRFDDFEKRGQSANWVERRGTVGDARGTANVSGEERTASASLRTEFIGDYNSVVATDYAGYAVWIDVASAQPCRSVSLFRLNTSRGISQKLPNLAANCRPNPDAFGNANLAGDVIPAAKVP